MKEIAKHGENNCFAGDFSKFDVRLPAQFTFAAFKVLIELSKKCGGY
jgi:hypothetical protein